MNKGEYYILAPFATLGMMVIDLGQSLRHHLPGARTPVPVLYAKVAMNRDSRNPPRRR